MKMVLKAKKETPDTTPLSKIKAKAVFEGQETGAERHLWPEKSMVTHFSLALAPGTAVATHVCTLGKAPPWRSSFHHYNLIKFPNHGEEHGKD